MKVFLLRKVLFWAFRWSNLMSYKLRQTFTKRLSNYTLKAEPIPARIGLDDGTVFPDPNNKRIIWVTYFNGDTAQVLNHRVASKPNVLVLVGYDPVQFPNRLQVLGMWDIYQDAQWGGIVSHADDHGWLGRDPLWIRGEQFLPALVVPVSGQLKVIVYPIALLGSLSWKLITVQTTVDVSASVPATGYRYGLLVMNSLGALVIRDGVIVKSRSLLTEDRIPVPTAGDNVIAALVLYKGQTQLLKNKRGSDILDLRFSNTISVPVAGASLTVKEVDGTPSVSSVETIRVSNGTLTDDGSGQVTITIGAGGGTAGLDAIDVSSQVIVGGETHFTFSPAAVGILVLVNGALQKPGDVTLDVDGLGVTLAFGVTLGDNVIVLRVASPASGGGGHTVQDNGTNMTQRTKLNIIGATVADDAGNDATKITIVALGGDVVGPASAVDSNFASFDTTTGKKVKDSGSKASDFASSGHTHTFVNHAQAVFAVEGSINATGTKPIRLHIPYVGAGATIEEVRVALNVAPSATAVRVDVNKNGTSIFNATQYVEMAVGSYADTKSTDFASTALAKDDYLTIEIVQGDIFATDLTVHVRYKWTLTGV